MAAFWSLVRISSIFLEAVARAFSWTSRILTNRAWASGLLKFGGPPAPPGLPPPGPPGRTSARPALPARPAAGRRTRPRQATPGPASAAALRRAAGETAAGRGRHGAGERRPQLVQGGLDLLALSGGQLELAGDLFPGDGCGPLTLKFELCQPSLLALSRIFAVAASCSLRRALIADIIACGSKPP